MNMPSLCVYYDLYDYSPTDIPLLLFQFFPNPLFLFSVRFLTDFSAAGIFYYIFVLFCFAVCRVSNQHIHLNYFIPFDILPSREGSNIFESHHSSSPTYQVGWWMGGWVYMISRRKKSVINPPWIRCVRVIWTHKKLLLFVPKSKFVKARA